MRRILRQQFPTKTFSVIAALICIAALTACTSKSESLSTPTLAEPSAMPPAKVPAPSDVPELTPTKDNTFDQAQLYVGEWSGEWRNTTFGSTGAARASTTAEPDGSATFTVDLDGFVFGALDPDPMTYIGTYTADGATFETPDDPLFGDLTIIVTRDGEITIQGELVPIDGIASLFATGTITADEVSLNYTVAFSGGGEAVGELVLTKTQP